MTTLNTRAMAATFAVAASLLVGACTPDPGLPGPGTTPSTTPATTTAPATTAPPTTAPLAWQQQMLTDLNAKRAANGFAPVSLCARLTTAAQGHSSDMAARQVLTHTGANGSSPGQRITATGYIWSGYGENVAAGQTSVTQVMNAWFNETPPNDGHRLNILNPGFVHVGVARATAANGAIYWTQDFGAGGTC